MATLVGASGSALLFTDNGRGVIVDSALNLVLDVGYTEAFEARAEWLPAKATPSQADLAQGALTSLDIAVTASAGRKYTIPKSVSSEATRALAKGIPDSASRVGVYVANKLSNGGQITLPEIRHMAHYFVRHENDHDSTASIRTAWNMWGGDAGQRWTSSVIEAENTKALTADGYVAPGYDETPAVYAPANSYPSDVNPFKQALDNPEMMAPEFIARVLLDGSGIDRLYRVDMDGTCWLWDDGAWDNVGQADGNIWTYDQTLDGPGNDIPSTHILVDAGSAIIIAAALQQNPMLPVSINDINQEEADLAAAALGDEDWQAVDDTTATTAALVAVGTVGDGIYTPAERSQNAEAQVRDANGKFAKMGSRVMIGGIPSNAGTITGLDPVHNTISVKLDNGQVTTVPSKSVEAIGQYSATVPGVPVVPQQVDLSGILGEPRVPINEPQAQIPGTLPAMTSNDLQQVLSNFPAWVAAQRASFKGIQTEGPIAVQPKGSEDIGDAGRAIEAKTHQTLWLDPYQHPLLKTWLSKQPNAALLTASGAPADGDNDDLGDSETPDTPPAGSVAASNANKASGAITTPDTSDVQPIYIAEVSPDDPRAVLELVSIVPASTTSNAPMTYKRQNGTWQADPTILRDLQSATPPPVVPLDAPTLKSVEQQVDAHQAPTKPAPVSNAPITQPNPDVPVNQAPAPMTSSAEELMVLWGPKNSAVQAITAAIADGGHPGDAEKLRRYWTVGVGGAKIRWDTPGDWTRCVQHLGKYLGPRAKGYCSLRHHEMTGMWPGDRRNRDQLGHTASGARTYSSDVILPVEKIIENAFLRAEARTLKIRMGLTAAIPPAQGARFKIPLIIPEGVPSGDGRLAEPGSLTWRNLPLPLMWQVQTAAGHDASYVVGRIDFMERTMEGIGNAWGYFDTGEFGAEAQRLVDQDMLRGISADLDQFEAQEVELTLADDEEAPDVIAKKQIIITQARIMGATIVAKPAFQECEIFIDNGEPQEDTVVPDGVYIDDVDPSDAAALVAAGYVAGAIPLAPPEAWFTNPDLHGPTPITVTDEGRVFGHIASWDMGHIGHNSNVRAPRSKSKYAYFQTGVLRTEEGSDVNVGQLTLAGGHAGLEASARDAVKHYDDTASAVADVKAGEDQFGIWVSGALRPDITPEQIRVLRASAPSGDWRPIKGNLELVAVCQVNVPGFPVARAMVASGQVTALVAAGAATLAKLQHDPVHELEHRLGNLERIREAELEAMVASAKATVHSVRDAELAAKAEALSMQFEALSEFRDIPRPVRMAMAKKGQAMPDGSFPIASESDLQNAIQAYGRAKNKTAVRAHIMKRARALGKSSMIPEDWKTAQSAALTASLETMQAKIAAASADPKVQKSSVPATAPAVTPDDTPTTADPEDDGNPGSQFVEAKHPRDLTGRFRDVLARISGNLGTSGVSDAATQIKQTQNLDSVGNYKAAVESAAKLANTLTRVASGAGSADRRQNLKDASTELSKTIANLPLPFGEDSQKVRYSDLPPAMRELTENLVAQVEAKKGQAKAAADVAPLKGFMSGFHEFSQRNISSQMNKMIHILTK